MRPIEELTYAGQTRRLRQLAVEVARLHGFASERFDLLGHAENTTFRARGPDGDFLLRIHRPGYQTPESIASELEWLAALRRDTQLVVPRPVVTDAGAVLSVGARGVEPRSVVAFEWIDGRFSRRYSVRSMRRLGRFMAELHEHATTFQPSADFARRHWAREGMLGGDPSAQLHLLPARHRSLFESATRLAESGVATLEFGATNFGLIHADLHRGNFLMHRGELAAIDFDDCGFGPFLYDLAVALHGPSLLPEFPELRDALVGGYREVRPLPDDEVSVIPAFLALRTVGVTLWIIDRAQENPKFLEFMDGHLERAAGQLERFMEK